MDFDFLSLEYVQFLISTTIIYWLLPNVQARLLVILTASLFFYSFIQKQYIWLLLVMLVVNFWLGGEIRKGNSFLKQWLLFVGIFFDVLLLFGFKYIPFVATAIGNITGLPVGSALAIWAKANIVPPITLSFFVFELIAYLVDIYRGSSPAKDFLNFAAYKLFFAKLLSGPITRYQEFSPQLVTRSRPILSDIVEGVWLFSCGAVKKGLVADNMGRLVDLIFRNADRAGSVDIWIALLAYSIQIYCDFSGYIDMARGSALLFGFRLPQNFDFPYFSASISDFWRRWHMTLGAWMRNYLYIPLGGSRGGLWQTCLNLMIIMLVVGIWHGANWGFIIWGLWHGAALVGHRLWMEVSSAFEGLQKMWKPVPMQILAIALTQLIVILGWIPFRLPNLIDANMVLQRLWGYGSDPQFGVKIYVESFGITTGQIALLMLGLLIMSLIAYRCDRTKWQLNWQVKLFLVPISLFLVSLFSPEKKLPFIYFDF
ncbi:MAG: membrane-bound O-acyltransferase family protein [Oscillatoriales cyanobacterium CG2_30_44_21]|nr:MAG: membrane-bound O-acyltransferase family protein [Oscillatoriales cyanobacterium CG2_30_44_21]